MAPPPLLHPTVEHHVHGLVGEDMLEVREPRRFRARDDEEQQSHQSPPPNHGLRSTPSRPRGVARLQRRSTPALTPDPGERRLGSSVLFVLFRKLMVPKIRGITEVGRGNILTRRSLAPVSDSVVRKESLPVPLDAGDPWNEVTGPAFPDGTPLAWWYSEVH